MAVTWETVSVPLVGGINTKVDDKTLLPTKLQLLENGEFTKGSAVRKRFGHTAVPAVLTDTSAVTGLLNVHSRSDELVASAQDKLYSMDGSANAWLEVDDYFAPTHTVQEVAKLSAQQIAPDTASTNGIRVAAWEDSRGGVRCTVYNETTGTPYSVDLSIQSSTAVKPRCIVVGSNILVLYADTSTNSIKAKVIETNNLATSLAAAVVTVINDLASTRAYDACSGGGDYGYILYGTDGAVSTGSRICTVSAGGVATSFGQGYTISTIASYAAVNYDETIDQVYSAVSDGSVWDEAIWDVDLVNIDANTDGIASTVNISGAQFDEWSVSGLNRVLFLETSAASPSNHQVSIQKTGSSDMVFRHSGLASSAFRMGDHVYVVITHESRTGLQNNYFLLRDDGLLCGRVLSGEGVGLVTAGILPRTVWDGTDVHVAVNFKRKLTVRDTSSPVPVVAQYEGKGIKHVTFDTAATPRGDELDGTLYLSGSQLWAYDGSQAVESGFHMFPDMLLADIAHNGTVDAGIVSGVTYNYRVYYEFTLANGQRYRSAAITRSFTTTLGQQIRLTIPTLRHTLKGTSVSIVVYRTEGDADVFYYRVSSPDPTTAATVNGYLANSISADTVTFDDGMADAGTAPDRIIDKEPDYICQGQVPNFGPEGCTFVAVAQNRLWLVGGGQNPNSVRYSKLHFDGQPAEFHNQFVSEAPDYGGNTTALGYINDVVVVFKERAVYALEGEGPDDTLQSGFYLVRPLSADSGCIEPGSLLNYSDGIAFKSPEGIYLVDQGFKLQYLGAEVERYNSQECVAATSIPDTNQVVFLMSDGVSLMYDTFYKQWSVYTNHLGLGAAVWRGTEYVYLRDDSQVYRRDTSLYTDAGVPYKLKIRTAPLRLQDLLQGFWRARRFSLLGKYISSHRLQIGVYYDREQSPFEVFEFAPDDVLALSTWGSEDTWGESGTYWGGVRGGSDYHFQHRFARQKCQSIRLEFEDLSTGVIPGASFELTELALEVGLRDGLGRVPASRKI